MSTEPGAGGTGWAEGLWPNGRAELLSGIVLEGVGITIWKGGVGIERQPPSHLQPPTAFAEGRSFPQPSSSSSPEGGLVSPPPQMYLTPSSVTNIELFFRSVNWDF